MGFATCECRWFFRGEVGGDVVDWFAMTKPWKQDRDLVSPEWPRKARVDHYVTIPNSRDIGIKWRGESVEGEAPRLEFKGKVASLGVKTFSSRAAGVVERWVKWTCDTDAIQAASLVDVEKRRLLRVVQLDRSSDGIEASPPSLSADDPSLQIELTKLRLAGQPYWTLGFEAFPDALTLRTDFIRSVSLFLREPPRSLELTPGLSSSYPEWLARHAHHDGIRK